MLPFRVRTCICSIAFASLATFYTSTATAGFLVNTFESNSRLFSVNPDTGSSTLIGFTGVGSLTDLASSTSGALLGSSFTSLYSINPTTASSSLIGSFGSTTSMVGLDFASNGILYGVEQAGTGGVFSINTTTGLATRLFNTSFSYEGDVAFSSGNVFYATDFDSGSGASHLIRIDIGSSTATDLGLIASGLTFTGLDFDQTGRLIAFANGGGIYAIPNFSSSGAGTFLSNWGISAGGATFVSVVPEPTSSVMLGLGLAGVAFHSVRRRKRAC